MRCRRAGRSRRAPQPQNIWNDEHADLGGCERLSLRANDAGGRIIIGGEDSTEIVEPEARDRLIAEKSRS
jgi:hypothetical protein